MFKRIDDKYFFYFKKKFNIFTKLYKMSQQTFTENTNNNNDIKLNSNNNNKNKISLQKLEEFLIKLNNLELDYENLPDYLIDYQKDIEEFISKHRIIDPDQCCGSGCNNCIMNEYEDNLDTYMPALQELCNKINKQN
jgi:hypothetical protein